MLTFSPRLSALSNYFRLEIALESDFLLSYGLLGGWIGSTGGGSGAIGCGGAGGGCGGCHFGS